MIDLSALIAKTRVETRPYQQRIISKSLDLLINKGLRSILIESPTGAGKTVMALLLAKVLQQEKQFRIGWVSMRRHLLNQAYKENFYKGIDVELEYISMFDKGPYKPLDVLIVDEAQHDVISSMAHIHASIKPKHIIGMTATPFRADRVKLCFDKVIKDAGIATLIQDGYLSRYNHFTIPIWNVEEVTRLYTAEKERWGKSIIYFHRLEQCAQAASILRRNNTTVEVVTGSSDTEEQIRAFRDGNIDVLVNCMKLVEGFDCPDLKTVWCRPSCKSVTIQMAGRVLRKHPAHEYKQIVQVDKTPYQFQKTALAVIQHVLQPSGWRTLEINKDIDKVNRRTIRALAKIEVDIPDFVKKNMAGPVHRRSVTRNNNMIGRTTRLTDNNRVERIDNPVINTSIDTEIISEAINQNSFQTS